jgi:hypothetical protein
MFPLSKFIHVPIFIISFIIGCIGVYIMGQGELRKIYVYPTPDNINLIQYKDSTGTCFEFVQNEVQCPVNKNQISKIPAQG